MLPTSATAAVHGKVEHCLAHLISSTTKDQRYTQLRQLPIDTLRLKLTLNREI
jgi:hypothetical protein